MARHGVYPSKELGQNFLIDKFTIKKAVKAAELTEKDTVLEVGPGIGNLTQALAKEAKRVVVVEKDLKMTAILRETLKDFNNVEVITGDILKTPEAQFKIRNAKYKVVANLPYYIVSPVIRKFLESELPPKEMVLITQKEVAQRICSKPPKMNLLAVSIQFYANPQIISFISRKAFWPEPNVDSAILKISKIRFKTSELQRDSFFKIVKAGFSQPRKMLVNNLANKLKVRKETIKEIIQKNSINLSQRPETLTVKDWRNIAREFSTLCLL